jgi:hypothetical protein
MTKKVKSKVRIIDLSPEAKAEYVESQKKGDLTIAEICEITGYSSSAFKAWKTKLSKGIKLSASTGRSELLSEIRYQELLAKIKSLEAAGNSPNDEALEKLVVAARVSTAQDAGYGESSVPEMKRSWYFTLKTKLNISKVSGQQQTQSRLDATMDIRNALSTASVFRAITHDGTPFCCSFSSLILTPTTLTLDLTGLCVSPLLLCNIDATTVEYVRGNDDVKVWIVSGSKGGAKVTGADTLTNRAKLLSAQFAGGSVADQVLIVRDKNPNLKFIEEIKVPSLHPSNSPTDVGWIWLVPKSYNDKDLFVRYITKIVLPALLANRGVLEETNAQLPGPLQSSLLGVLIFDGEMAQVFSVIDNYKGLLDLLKGKRVRVFKIPANTSSRTQPNDVGKTFLTLHSLAKGHLYKHIKDDFIFKILSAAFDNLKYIVSKTRRTHLIDFISILKPIFASAFRGDNVTIGWKDTGLYPFNELQILRQFTRHRKVTAQEEKTYLAHLPALEARAFLKGRVIDPDFDDLGIPKDKYQIEAEKKRPSVSDRQEYQQRALWLDHDSVISSRKQKLEEKKAAADMLLLVQADKVVNAAEKESKKKKKKLAEEEKKKNQQIYKQALETKEGDDDDDEPCFFCGVWFNALLVAGYDGKSWESCLHCGYWFCSFCVPSDDKMNTHVRACKLRLIWEKEKAAAAAISTRSPSKKKSKTSTEAKQKAKSRSPQKSQPSPKRKPAKKNKSHKIK